MFLYLQTLKDFRKLIFSKLMQFKGKIMKIIALDLGDVHTGVANADDLGLFATPLTTVPTTQLNSWLEQLISKESIKTIVVGYPQTLKGTESEQTRKVLYLKDQLAQQFPTIKWILWDERLTSKQAQSFKSKRIKKDKNREHAIAAALILQTYLESLRF